MKIKHPIYIALLGTAFFIYILITSCSVVHPRSFSFFRFKNESRIQYNSLNKVSKQIWDRANFFYNKENYWNAIFEYHKLLRNFPESHYREQSYTKLGNSYRALSMIGNAAKIYKEGHASSTNSGIRFQNVLGFLLTLYPNDPGNLFSNLSMSFNKVSEGTFWYPLYSFVKLHLKCRTKCVPDILIGNLNRMVKKKLSSDVTFPKGMLFNIGSHNIDNYPESFFNKRLTEPALLPIQKRDSILLDQTGYHALHALFMAYHATEKLDSSLYFLLQAANHSAPNFEINNFSRIKTGHFLFINKKYSKALKYYKLVIPESKYHEEALISMAYTYYKTRKYVKCRQTCEKLLDDYPESIFSVEAQFLIGKANFDYGEKDKAYNDFLKARDMQQMDIHEEACQPMTLPKVSRLSREFESEVLRVAKKPESPLIQSDKQRLNSKLKEKLDTYDNNLRQRQNCRIRENTLISHPGFLDNILAYLDQPKTAPPLIHSLSKTPTKSRSFGLFLAVNDYKSNGRIENLRYPISDAEKLKKVLISKYKFHDIDIISNPDMIEIRQAFVDLGKKITPSDYVLIFYSGHGAYDSRTGSGYWLPSDAEPDTNLQINWIDNNEVSKRIKLLNCRKILIIADACFSSSLIIGKNKLVIQKEYPTAQKNEISREVITSGNFEPVPDKSIFIEFMIRFLENNSSDKLSANDLYDKLKDSVPANANQIHTPMYGILRNSGHHNGSFQFERLKSQFPDG